MNPVEGLEDQWHRGCTTATKDHRADPHSRGVLPIGINDRTISGRSGEAAVRVATEDRFAIGVLRLRRPILAFPVNQMGRRFLCHSLPPDITIICKCNVCEDGIALDGVHRHRIAIV